VEQLAPPSSDSKVLAVQSWDGVPRKNPDEPPYPTYDITPGFNPFTMITN